MYCTQCGTKLPDDAKFCVSCGTQINITNEGIDGVDKSECQREVDTPQRSACRDDAVFSKETEALFARFMSGEYKSKDVNEVGALTKKFVNYWENKFCETKDQEDGINLIIALAMAVRYFDYNNSYTQIEELCKSILSTSKFLYDKFGGIENFKRVAWSYNVMGDEVFLGAREEERKGCYQKSLELYDKIPHKDQTADEKECIAFMHISMGEIYIINQGKGPDSDKGEKWLLKADELLEKLNYETGSLENRKLLISAYKRMSLVSFKYLDEAEKWSEKWARLAEGVCHDSMKSEDWQELSVAYTARGSILFSQGRKTDAKTMYEKAVEVGEMLLRETNTAEAADNLAMLYMDYATIDEGHYDQTMLKKARKILQRLTRAYPQTAQYADDLQSVNAKLKSRAR